MSISANKLTSRLLRAEKRVRELEALRKKESEEHTNKLVLMKASAEAATSLLLDVQRDCIAAVKRAVAAETRSNKMWEELKTQGFKLTGVTLPPKKESI